MNLLGGTFAENLPVSVQLILVTLILVALLYLVFWILRRSLNLPVPAQSPGNPPPRLAVVDAANVDGKRRLVIVRRDNIEHLVMIGGSSELLIESNLQNVAVPVHTQQPQLAASNLPSEPEFKVQEEDLPDFDNLFDQEDAKQIAEESDPGKTALSSWRSRLNRDTTTTTAATATTSAATVSTQASSEPVEVQTPSIETAHEDVLDHQDDQPMPNLASALDEELSEDNEVTAEALDANAALDELAREASAEIGQVEEPVAAQSSSSMPNKQDMEDEMQRLLNELSGEKSPTK